MRARIARCLVVASAVAIAVVMFGAAPAYGADADPCAAVEAVRPFENPARAAETAEACLAVKPDAVGAWITLARARTFADRLDDALTAVDAALKLQPLNLEARIVRIRVLAFLTRLDEAAGEAAALTTAEQADPEAARLFADLAFWRGDHADAVRRYDEEILRAPLDVGLWRNRGLSKKAMGDRPGALRDLDQACRLDRAQCIVAENTRAELARFTASLYAGYAWAPRGAGQGANIIGSFYWRAIPKTLTAGVIVDVRNRDYGGSQDWNALLLGNVIYTHPSRFRLDVGAGGTPAATFAPVYSAWIEPGINVPIPNSRHSLDFALKYWRLGFKTAGAHIIQPSFIWAYAPFAFTVRYYLTIRDADHSLAHFVLGRVTFAPIDLIELNVGGGAGNSPDFLDLRDSRARLAWVALGSIAFQLNWQHRVEAIYSYRFEDALLPPRAFNPEGRRLISEQHQFWLGYRVNF